MSSAPEVHQQDYSRGVLEIGRKSHELGIMGVNPGQIVPSQAKWAVSYSPDYGSTNLLQNPLFEYGSDGWELYTPPNMSELSVKIVDEDSGRSAVMISDKEGYRGGLLQTIQTVPANTRFHFKAMIRTSSVDELRVTPLYWNAWDSDENWYGGNLDAIQESVNWALYELSFTTPNNTTRVTFYPALVYNKGQVWIRNASLETDNAALYPHGNVSLILDWCDVHQAWVNSSLNTFRSEAVIEEVERRLKSIEPEKFWGIIFISEEHYRLHIDFSDETNVTWFGERLLGYPLYLQSNPNATRDEWKDEMFLAMLRGFYNYFHGKTEVGITAGDGVILRGNLAQYFGEQALDFIRKYYDFVILYRYTSNLNDFQQTTRSYLSAADQLFSGQREFWILTRAWDYNEKIWQPESTGLELKNCLDRNMVILCYCSSEPCFEEIWAFALKGFELCDKGTPYFERDVYGKTLLTGTLGITYGWVELE